MHFSSVFFATLFALPQCYAQDQIADGVLVPFTTALPKCASLCGPLSDVQGGCADKTCFCADGRLTPMRQSGTAGVSTVCGPLSCTVAADLEKVKSWYVSFCDSTTPTASTTKSAATAGATSGSGTSSGTNSGNTTNNSSPTNDSWLARHTRWVIMIVVVVVGLILLWVGAWYFRRRYLRKREREIEMSPPVAWGPNQVQGANGGYQYGDGIVDDNRPAGAASGGHHKEMSSSVPAHGKRLSKAKMGWFKANK